MKISTLISCLKLRKLSNYLSHVRNMDCEKVLGNEPLIISDKQSDGKELKKARLSDVVSQADIHSQLFEKYSLGEVAGDGTDFEKTVAILKWLTENTRYSGVSMKYRPDNGLGILDSSFRKPFKYSINCRDKAIAFADCLIAVGIKAYPVCMLGSKFVNCHFNCHVYLRELDKWCNFDPSFGCWFTDENGDLLDAFEIRRLFTKNSEPVIHGYDFNGTTESIGVYKICFLKSCMSNLSTWENNFIETRQKRKTNSGRNFKVFDCELPR